MPNRVERMTFRINDCCPARAPDRFLLSLPRLRFGSVTPQAVDLYGAAAQKMAVTKSYSFCVALEGKFSFTTKYCQTRVKNLEVIQYSHVMAPQAIVPFGAAAQKRS